MKALVRCTIISLGGDHRMVHCDRSTTMFLHRWSDVLVSYLSCRMPDGSPIDKDYPPIWDEHGDRVKVSGLLEVEVKVPELISLEIKEGCTILARPEDIEIIGERGKPVYRLALVGEIADATVDADQGSR